MQKNKTLCWLNHCRGNDIDCTCLSAANAEHFFNFAFGTNTLFFEMRNDFSLDRFVFESSESLKNPTLFSPIITVQANMNAVSEQCCH